MTTFKVTFPASGMPPACAVMTKHTLIVSTDAPSNETGVADPASDRGQVAQAVEAFAQRVLSEAPCHWYECPATASALVLIGSIWERLPDGPSIFEARGIDVSLERALLDEQPGKV